MRSGTLLGIIFGLVAIFGAFLWEGGTIDALFMLPAMVIVFGGTLAAGLAGSSWAQLALMPKLILLCFNSPKFDRLAISNQIVEFSIIARREGILSIERRMDKVKHPFLRKLFQISVDGADPETLTRIVESEIAHITSRHETNINFFKKLGGYSPTMGIIGTVMGLISTLAAAGDDPNVLIHNIATAFIATMWGILMANIVWLPISDKLDTLHQSEMELYQIMLDGVHSVQSGEMPSVIKAKLLSSFPLSAQEKISQEQNKILDQQFKNIPKQEDSEN